MTSLKKQFLKNGHCSLIALSNNGLDIDACKYILSILLALLSRSLNESLSLHEVYNGIEFNRICKDANAKMYKFVNYDSRYEIGLNVADRFNIYLNGDNKLCYSGLHFNAGDKFRGSYYRDDGTRLALIEIPDDAQVFVWKHGLTADKLIVKDIDYLCNVDNDDFWIDMIQNNGLMLEFVKNQTDKICESAVQQNGRALWYVKNQTKEIIELAALQVSKCKSSKRS